jgi:hypothetical protein
MIHVSSVNITRESGLELMRISFGNDESTHQDVIRKYAMMRLSAVLRRYH